MQQGNCRSFEIGQWQRTYALSRVVLQPPCIYKCELAQTTLQVVELQ